MAQLFEQNSHLRVLKWKVTIITSGCSMEGDHHHLRVLTKMDPCDHLSTEVAMAGHLEAKLVPKEETLESRCSLLSEDSRLQTGFKSICYAEGLTQGHSVVLKVQTDSTVCSQSPCAWQRDGLTDGGRIHISFEIGLLL